MKAIVKSGVGPGHVEYAEVPVPQPKAGQVLIKMRAAGLCGADILLYDWTYRGKRPVVPPLILGHEGTGEIVELGPDVDGFCVGDRVAMQSILGCGKCPSCQRGHTHLCSAWTHLGMTYDGVFADHVIVPAEACHKLPDRVSNEEGAFLEFISIAAHTDEKAPFRAGETVVVVGPGPFGLLHLQAAKSAGAARLIVTGLDKDAERLAIARRMGATHTVNAEGQDPVQAVLDLTDGYGADMVIEAGGTPDSVSQALRMARPDGRVVLLGYALSAEIVPISIVRSDLTICGVVASKRQHYQKALRWMESGLIRAEPLITHRMTLNDFNEAVDLFRGRRAIKVLFEI
jgi:L-iditol 2-dehydrogenase